MRNSLLFLFAFCLMLSACHKGDDSPAPTNDTLAQTIYNVSNFGTVAPGNILASPNLLSNPNSGQLFIMDANGHLLKQKQLDGAGFCFRKWNIDGQTRYTCIVNDPGYYHIPTINQLTGYALIMDSNLNELKRVSLLPYGNLTNSNHQGIDVHEFILLSDDHYIQFAYYEKNVSNIPAALNPAPNVKVVAAIIQEVNNGAVVWQWDSSDFPEFYTNSIEGNNFSDSTTVQDYMHMNSLFIDPRDNNYIVSFRNQNQVIKINHQTGAIMWRLGGKNSDFNLSTNQNFLRQHNATLTDNNQTLMLFDNGELTQRPSSRVLEFKLDEAGKQVTGFNSFDIPEPFTQYMGSVQKMGDHYFIGGGTDNYVLEVNYKTGQKLFEMTSSNYTYRAYKQ